jgi:hypothetical protein
MKHPEPKSPAVIDQQTVWRRPMSKILIGMAAGALWFVLSHAANAERICKEVCDGGTCVSRCVNDDDHDTVIHEHDRGPGVHLHGSGADIDIDR